MYQSNFYLDDFLTQQWVRKLFKIGKSINHKYDYQYGAQS